MSSLKYFTHIEFKITLIEGWARDVFTDEQIYSN